MTNQKVSLILPTKLGFLIPTKPTKNKARTYRITVIMLNKPFLTIQNTKKDLSKPTY